MAKLTVFRGLPGSGKSTEAEIISRETGAVIVERDLIRERLSRTRKMGNTDEVKVTKVQEAEVLSLLRSDIDVLVSDTFIRDKYVRNFAKLAWLAGAEFEQRVMYVSVEECIERDKHRNHTVGEDVIRGMDKRFSMKPADVSDIIFDVEPYGGNKDLDYVGDRMVIFDLDGTCFEMGDRTPFEWHKVHLDKPNTMTLFRTARAHADYGDAVVFLSGRDEVCRDATYEMLHKQIPFWDFQLHMRANKDMRPDTIVKYELFNKHIRPTQAPIVGIWDDRPAVCALWRKMGLPLNHVGDPYHYF